MQQTFKITFGLEADLQETIISIATILSNPPLEFLR